MPAPNDDEVILSYQHLTLTELLVFLEICRKIEPEKMNENSGGEASEETWSVHRLAIAPAVADRVKSLRQEKEGTKISTSANVSPDVLPNQIPPEVEDPTNDSEPKKRQLQNRGDWGPEEQFLRRLLLKFDEVLVVTPDGTPTGMGQDSSKPALSLFKKFKGQINGLTPYGRKFRKIVERHEMIVNDTERERVSAIKLSVAEAVATYILPEILWERQTIVGMEKDERVPVRLERSDLRFLESGGDLEREHIDAAIVWDPNLRGWQGTACSSLTRQPIKGSRVPLCLVFHASHEFAGWLQKNRNQVRTAADLQAGLRGYALHYPGELTVLRELASDLAGRDQARLFRTEGFPAVIAQVRMGIAIGVFPYWPAVLHRLRVEDHIYHEPLPDDFQERVGGLVAYFRTEEDERTKQAKILISDVERAFRDAASATVWKPVACDTPFLDPVTVRAEWKVYYLNRSSGDMPFPKWRTGKWVLQNGENVSTRKGTYTMTRDEQDRTYIFGLQGEVTHHSMHVISSFGSGPSTESRNPTTVTFLRWFARTSDEADEKLHILFGFIHTAHKQTTSVAPFLLCPPELELGLKDLRSICGQVEFHTRANKL